MQEETAGVRHLKDLQQAGLTHVHLLPSYDYGSVPERVEDQELVRVSDLCSFAIAKPFLTSFKCQSMGILA